MKKTTPNSNGRRREPSILLHADNTDPDMWYFSRFNAFDPYLAFSVDGRRVAVITAAEYGRMAKESAFDEILLLDEVRKGAARRFKLPKNKVPDLHEMVLHLAKLHDIPNFRVGPRFPVGLARKLRESGMTLEIANGSGLFPERQIKTAAEVEALRKGNKACEAGFRVVAKTLAESKIRNGKLVHGGSILTAERLRDLISHTALDAGALALHTIAAPGDQAVDNHCVGHGPIRAGRPAILHDHPAFGREGWGGCGGDAHCQPRQGRRGDLRESPGLSGHVGDHQLAGARLQLGGVLVQSGRSFR
jgi:Xaa-Pro aminopeptidase